MWKGYVYESPVSLALLFTARVRVGGGENAVQSSPTAGAPCASAPCLVAMRLWRIVAVTPRGPQHHLKAPAQCLAPRLQAPGRRPQNSGLVLSGHVLGTTLTAAQQQHSCFHASGRPHSHACFSSDCMLYGWAPVLSTG